MSSLPTRIWQELRWIVRVSRPRFWLYLFGPYLIGIVTAMRTNGYGDTPFLERTQDLQEVGKFILEVLFSRLPTLFLDDPLAALTIIGFIILLIGYPLLPGNLFIYGINDIFDINTDKLNPNKDDYEHRLAPNKRRRLLIWIILLQLPWLGLGITSLFVNQRGSILRPTLAFLVFLFLGIFYSAPPIRAKARPFLDSFFNILYILPGLYTYFGLLDPDGIIAPVPFPWLPVLAGSLWCMVVHACKAVPDIKMDLGANLPTIATRLGVRPTLWLCALFSISATLLAFIASSSLGIRLTILLLGTIYLSLIGYSLRHEHQLTSIQRYAHWIHNLSLLILFLSLLLF